MNNKDNEGLGASLPLHAVPLNRDFTFVMRMNGDTLHYTEDGCHWGVQISPRNRRYLHHFPGFSFKPCHVCFPHGMPQGPHLNHEAG